MTRIPNSAKVYCIISCHVWSSLKGHRVVQQHATFDLDVVKMTSRLWCWRQRENLATLFYSFQGNPRSLIRLVPCVAALMSAITCKTLWHVVKVKLYHILSQINNRVKKVLIWLLLHMSITQTLCFPAAPSHDMLMALIVPNWWKPLRTVSSPSSKFILPTYILWQRVINVGKF